MTRKSRTLLLVLLIVLVFTALFILKAAEEMKDFEVNYRAGSRVRLGETLYRASDGHYQFKYPPFSALLYVPFSFLPLTLAKAAWYWLIIFAIVATALLSRKLAGGIQKRGGIVSVIPLLVLARFFLRELQLGQINALVTLLLLLVVMILSDPSKNSSLRAQGASGLIWGIASCLKPYALIFFPYFLIKKRWISLSVGLVAIGLAAFSPSLFLGVSGNEAVHKEWLASLAQSTPSLLDSQDNVSLLALGVKWTGEMRISFWGFGLAVTLLAAIYLFLVLKGRKVPRPATWDGGLLLVFIPLISPLGWDYTFLSAYLSLDLIFNHFELFPKLWRILLGINSACVFFLIYDLLGPGLYSALMRVSLPTLNFLFFTAALFYLRFKEHC